MQSNFFWGGIGDIYSLGEVVFNNITPCFQPFLGVTNVWLFFISHDHVTGFSLQSLICFAVKICLFNFLNITPAFHTCGNILTLSFFTCYSSHLYVHFQMHSPSVEKPNFGNSFLFCPSAPGLLNITPYLCSPLKYHASGVAPHHFISSPSSTVPKPCHPLP